MFTVEVSQNQETAVVQTSLPEKPKSVTAMAYYQMEQESKDISAIYLEICHAGSNEVTYLEIPMDTKVNLSEELYKNLQTYAPELPLYFKLSNMAENFSGNYVLTGATRILSEVLGISVTDYVRADEKAMKDWFLVQQEDVSDREFFDAYMKWIGNSVSDQTAEERWMYYESRKKVQEIQIEQIPGNQEKDGYMISEKRSKERLKELMMQKKE